MSSIFTKNFGVYNAKNFERFITAAFGTVYMGIGRNRTWDTEPTAPTPTDTANTFYQIWDDLIGLKKITAADMNLVVPRIDWTSGTTYSEYTENLQLFAKIEIEDIQYAYKFYVRNNKDQVFKCLYNNFNAVSTIMPEIDLGGQLPENAFIQTADGYRWKYLYTIPPGLKEKFFTTDFMPVTNETIVRNTATDGRIDIIKIVTAGSGFRSNTNSNSYNILTVTGNGTGANLTARVATTSANGANITGVNILSGGSGYTKAAISINDPLKLIGTQSANLVAVIGPPGGHGSDIEQELGASNMMISVNIEGDEGGIFPINSAESVGFRQIVILKDVLQANSTAATLDKYRTTTKYQLSVPSGEFDHNETVYVGTSLATATFTGVVEHYDNAGYNLYLNNINGAVTTPATITGAITGATAAILSVTEPDVKRYSGDLLYIDNTTKIVRTLEETEQLKLTLRF